MKGFFTTGIVIISSLLGATIIISNVNAAPNCHGIDPEGNPLDLSSLCSPISNPNSVPSSPLNADSQPEEISEDISGIEDNKSPELSDREEAEKNLQACFSNPSCSGIMGEQTEPEKTPHQIRIDQIFNGGRPNQNQQKN